MTQTTQIHPNSENSSQNDGRILVVASPLQGHAAPLLKLCHQITSLGTKVTFLTTDSARTCLIEASNGWDNEIRIISVPDGLELEDVRKDQRKLYFSLLKVLPGYLEDLLKETNRSIKNDNDRIRGVIVDASLTLLLGIAKKMGIKNAAFWCSTPGCLALGLRTPQLIEDEVINVDGTPLKDASIQLLPNMPAMSQSELTWCFPGDINTQKEIFNVMKGVIYHLKDADWVLSNWFHELEPSGLVPRLYTVGPLLAKGLSAGSFYPEDSTCINWLDKQPEKSVVYAAFGSTARFTQQQFDELANGLELLGRPFLWVTWSGLSNGVSRPYSDEFKERVAERGKLVEWAPQEAILNHPSITCFITHCGWSSFLESLSAGVPMLCWPYFGDQMYTQSCICDGWRVGMRLKPDEGSGVIRRNEIVQKVDQLFCDEIIKENALKWKVMANKSTSKGGSSVINLEYVLQHMR